MIRGISAIESWRMGDPRATAGWWGQKQRCFVLERNINYKRTGGQEDIDFTIQDSIKENYGWRYDCDLPVLLIKLNVHSVCLPPRRCRNKIYRSRLNTVQYLREANSHGGQ